MNKTIIDASYQRLFPDIKEVFRYRDLFKTLTWRDLRVRYAQTTIGLLWALLQPLATLAILSIVFGKFVGVKTPVPHLLYTVSGLSLWTYFSFVMTNSGNSIINNQGMIKKIYFPRIIIPLSKAVVGLIDLGISMLIFIILLIWYGIIPSINFWMAPVFILIGMFSALGIGIWLSALTVRFRDFQHIVPFIVQLGLYITPVAYPAEYAIEQLPGWASALYYLNPMAGVIQGFRWCLFGGESPGYLMYVSFAITFLIFLTGLVYFQKIEKDMADFV